MHTPHLIIFPWEETVARGSAKLDRVGFKLGEGRSTSRTKSRRSSSVVLGTSASVSVAGIRGRWRLARWMASGSQATKGGRLGLQVNPKVARFRRHPFHQYEIFEKICAENIAVGSDARCTKMSEPVVNLNSEEDAPHIEEDFLAANGVSYDMNGTPPNNQTNTVGIDPSVEMDPSPTIRTKRSSDKPTKAAKCPKRKNGLQNLNELLVDSNKNAILFRETIESTDPYSMRDCLAKFPVTVQVDLVIACAVLHNFIGRYHGHDMYFNMSQTEMEHDSERGNVEMLDEDPNLHATIGERIQGDAIRHVIATDMWNARINCQRNRSS